MSSQVIQQSTPQGSAEWVVGPKAQDEESTAPTAPTALPSSGVQATKRSVEITIPNGVHPGNTITVRQNLTQKKILFRLSLSLSRTHLVTYPLSFFCFFVLLPFSLPFSSLLFVLITFDHRISRSGWRVLVCHAQQERGWKSKVTRMEVLKNCVILVMMK